MKNIFDEVKRVAKDCNEAYGGSKRKNYSNPQTVWNQQFEKEVNKLSKNKLAGKIEWSAAKYFYDQALSPASAAQKYVKSYK